MVNTSAEPFPYTKIRDWIALLPASELGDGAFRLYYLSRSVIWEDAKGGAPPKPVVEITYEEYAMILGRSARTISRFAQDLFAAGLWEEVERTHRSIKVPGKSRPEVRTVLTIRVHDFPREPWTFAGPAKTWDVLSGIRESRRSRESSTTAADPECDATDLSAQCDQGEPGPPDGARTEATDLSPQSERTCPHNQPQGPPPAPSASHAGATDPTSVSAPGTDLSADSTVSAGQNACGAALKKKGEERKPSLPPTPSPAERESIADELAMFSTPTIQLVEHLYDKTLTTPGLQPLSAAERVGLARRIESRFAEGWTVSRIRAVLTGGSLAGVRMPGRLWAGRLDEMPAPPIVPAPRTAPDDDHPHPRASASSRAPAIQINDCSTLPDPNAGRSRYEVPEGRGGRMEVRWADSNRVPPWCGRCSSDARTLSPKAPGSLPHACPDCHPEPHSFPVPGVNDPKTAPQTPSETPSEAVSRNRSSHTQTTAAAATATA